MNKLPGTHLKCCSTVYRLKQIKGATIPSLSLPSAKLKAHTELSQLIEAFVDEEKGTTFYFSWFSGIMTTEEWL